MAGYRVTCKAIRLLEGKCPVYETGDKMIFEEPVKGIDALDLGQTTAKGVCMRAIQGYINERLVLLSSDRVYADVCFRQGESAFSCTTESGHNPCGRMVFNLFRDKMQ